MYQIILQYILTLLHEFVEHDPTHVLDIVELLVLEKLDDLTDILFLNPDKQNTFLHHLDWYVDLLELCHSDALECLSSWFLGEFLVFRLIRLLSFLFFFLNILLLRGFLRLSNGNSICVLFLRVK
jgi:hypothetical protein